MGCPSFKNFAGALLDKCDPRQTCVDIPDDGCELGLGGADCLGRCLDSCAEADCGEMPDQAPCPNGGGDRPNVCPTTVVFASGMCPRVPIPTLILILVPNVVRG